MRRLAVVSFVPRRCWAVVAVEGSGGPLRPAGGAAAHQPERRQSAVAGCCHRQEVRQLFGGHAMAVRRSSDIIERCESVWLREPHALGELWGPTHVLIDGRKGNHMPLVGQCVLGSTEVVQQTTEHIQRIRERLRTAQSRQKSYADRWRSDLEFHAGDRVLLKALESLILGKDQGGSVTCSLWNVIKLGPRYIGPLTVLARVGKVTYRLGLPDVLGQIHDTFHVSQLRKCHTDETTHVPMDDILVDESLNYVEKPVAVLERKVKQLQNKEIGIVKVQWQHWKGSEWTWEPKRRCERSIRNSSQINFGNKIL
ncbi:hypothetical protein OSB04_023821, partial [Centaurea solstitialis]